MMRTRSNRLRLRVTIHGGVQGVGFRPFLFRLADELGLDGWTNNTLGGVVAEVEGADAQLRQYLLRIESDKPPRSSIHSLECSWLDPVGYAGFEIRDSDSSGPRTTVVLPDIAVCEECLREIFDPANRRHLYPFTNCTQCGPRFSIIESLPYDRANTSMKGFTMCAHCQAEYDDPRDRRFHAQPNACPRCGPRVELWPGRAGGHTVNAAGRPGGHEAIQQAAGALREGRIVAVKGLGGFHLMVAAHDDRAVRRLRELKHREEKPFAIMFPSLETARKECEVSVLEERLLQSPESPIVLLKRISEFKSQISDQVAPGNPILGVMLPYTPLHALLMSEVQLPVVATSGNLSDEPICIDEHEALDRLGGIADWLLVHNRPIIRHVDDSVTRVVLERERVLRRARGYAPMPVRVENSESRSPEQGAAGKTRHPSILAVGAHLKNAVALAIGSQAFISQHIGDLETEQAFDAFRHAIFDLEKLYQVAPSIVAADAHPDYLSTNFARELAESPEHSGKTETVEEANSPVRLALVQHHVAHVLSCMVENEVEPPVLGVAWDGTGYGQDRTVWGGEFFVVDGRSWRRVAHLRSFRLPGGDAAVREPRRSAAGLLYEAFGDGAFDVRDLPSVAAVEPAEMAAFRRMLASGLNSPRTSSVGRLFDAVAAVIGLRQRSRFEGQAAMELEFAIGGTVTDEAYPFGVHGTEPQIMDWSKLVESVVADIRGGVGASLISLRFHNALVEWIVGVAEREALERVVLSGGCFQNVYLMERADRRLRDAGFRPYWHQRVPPNDGGIALGQVAAALRGIS